MSDTQDEKVKKIDGSTRYNEENAKKLALTVVESWDQKGLLTFAVERLEKIYNENEQAFKDDCEYMGA